MKRRAARRRTLIQQRETTSAMTSKSMAQHKVSKKVWVSWYSIDFWDFI
jgi:hypothetical protein